MNYDEASVNINNSPNIVSIYNYDEAIIYKSFEESYKSDSSKLNIVNYDKENFNKDIEDLLYSKDMETSVLYITYDDEETEEDIPEIQNIKYSIPFPKNINLNTDLKEWGNKSKLFLYNGIFRYQSYSDIEPAKCSISFLETPVIYEKMNGYSTLNIIHDGETISQNGSIKSLSFTGSLNTFTIFKIEFEENSIENIKGLPAGLEFYQDDNIIKGTPITHGIFNCEIILKDNNKFDLNIEITPIERKF